MSNFSSKISNFWKEVKRRHVHRSLAIYAGSSFVFLEAATIIFPRWGFPDWTIDLVLYLVILGALITLVVTWIFDITPEGVQKTKPLEEAQHDEKPADSNAWKLATYISLVVIILLITFNVVPFNKIGRSGKIEGLIFLPFDNFTGDENLEYLVSGIHSSLITDMGKVGALRVICKTTANSFKGTELSVSQIASEMNVEAAVEGSISCVGDDSVCVQIRLIRATDEEEQLWVQDYRVAKDKFLNFFNDVTKKISQEINVVLSPQEESLLAESRTVDPEAYKAYLMGQFYWEKLDMESIQKAMEYFQKAIDLEPEWADPYVGLANAWGLFGRYDVLPKSVTLPKKYHYLNKALELDPNSAQAHYGIALNSVWTEWDWEKGEREFIKSLELNPNDALCRLYYAHLLMILRRSEEAVQQANLGIELDPMSPLVLGLYGVVMDNVGDYESSITHLEKALSNNPDFGFAAVNLMEIQRNVAYINGDYEKWIDLWGEKVKGIWKEEGRLAVLNIFQEKGHIAAIEEMFKMNEKYGEEGCHMSDGIKMERNLKLKNYDKVIDNLEKMYENPSINSAYIATNRFGYEELKDKPRYIELLKKMNLKPKETD